jgi:hypothetical protein
MKGEENLMDCDPSFQASTSQSPRCFIKPLTARFRKKGFIDRANNGTREPRGRLTFKAVLWVTIVAIILSNTPMVLAEDHGQSSESADFSQEDGDGIIEPGENAQEELAKAVQNPVASMISLPFQNNTNFGVGPDDKIQNVLNIQPVWPFALTEDINLITRTIAPIVSQPGIRPGEDRTTGLGDITFTAFLSPANAGKLIWGVGPVFLFPTATDDVLGADKWGLGPSAVLLTMPGNWVIGSVVSNIWSFAGSGHQDVNFFLWQPFVNYNLPKGWYLTSSPIITANWEARSGQKWIVPVGGGFGKIFRIGSQPMNASIQGFYHVEKPDVLGDWAMRVQLQFMFPK